MTTITLELTAAQKTALEPLMARSRQASIDDEPGMVLAQIFHDGMRANFIPHSKARRLAEVKNGAPSMRSHAAPRDEEPAP